MLISYLILTTLVLESIWLMLSNSLSHLNITGFFGWTNKNLLFVLLQKIEAFITK